MSKNIKEVAYMRIPKIKGSKPKMKERKNMDATLKTTAMLGGCLLLVVMALLINPLIIMLCWNYIGPWLFVGTPMITFWQAVVISLLSGALFGRGTINTNNNK